MDIRDNDQERNTTILGPEYCFPNDPTENVSRTMTFRKIKTYTSDGDMAAE